MARPRYRTRITESAKYFLRLMVRLSDFYSDNTGSIPVGSTKCGIAGIGRQHWLRISGRKTLGFEPLIPHHYARLTQLGECYLYKVEAVGSNPTSSTKYERWIRKFGAIAQLGEHLIGGVGNNSFHLILHSLSILVICWITLKMLR